MLIDTDAIFKKALTMQIEYLLRPESGDVESPEEVVERLVSGIILFLKSL